MEDKLNRMRSLVNQLNQASDVYYNGKGEILTDYEWDALFDQLKKLEEETGEILPDSPTNKVSEDTIVGQKEEHEFAALSLAKTKKVSDLVKWAEDRPIWISWKLDGLTLVVTYDNGKLTKVVTRGNGHIGTNITHLAPAISGIPLSISEKGHLVIRGEAVISYADFEQFIIESEGDYANPRNLASGSLSLKDVEEVKQRHIQWIPFTLVYCEQEITSWGKRMQWLEEQGFHPVERQNIEQPTSDNIQKEIDAFTAKVTNKKNPFPVDGLVICYDDTSYAATGSVTGHHATRAGYAFKWQDEHADTELDHIEWSCAASTITPVAVFDPVQLEGTTVTRASLCNVSELERLGIGKDRKTELRIIKANKIIPKCIAVVRAEGSYEVPTACPVCGAATEVRISPISGVKTLRCTDPNCPAKHLKRFVRFASKGGLDIDGLSVQTLHEFVNRGYLRDFADLYHLDAHADEIVKLEGFGEKSCANLLAAIEKSRKVDPIHLIFALCIPNIGTDAGKKLIAALGTKGFLSRIESGEGFEDVDGIGVERSNALLNWFADDENKNLFDRLMAELTLEDVAPKQEADGTCKGLSFVITGDVHLFKNRSAFKAYVEQQGGAVTGSVSGKTTYLVSNDGESNSSKTKKAKELGVPILSEEEFVSRFGGPESADSAEVQIGIDTLL